MKGQRLTELRSSVVLGAATDAAHRAGQRLAGDELLAPQVLFGPVAADLLDQRVAARARFAAQDQPLDLFPDLLGSQVVVDVDRQVERALEARLHHDVVDGLAVQAPQQTHAHAAGDDVAQTDRDTVGEQEHRFTDQRRLAHRREQAPPVVRRYPLVEDHHVLPAVLEAPLGIDRDARRGAEPVAEALEQLLRGPTRRGAQLVGCGEQPHAVEKGADPAIAGRMRRSVRREESEQPAGQPLLALGAGAVGLLDDDLELVVVQRALGQARAGLRVEQLRVGLEEPLQHRFEARLALGGNQHLKGATPHALSSVTGRPGQE